MKLVRPNGNGSAIVDSRVLLFVFGIGILVIHTRHTRRIRDSNNNKLINININIKTSNIFLTKQEALHYLRADADGFYRTLKPWQFVISAR